VKYLTITIPQKASSIVPTIIGGHTHRFKPYTPKPKKDWREGGGVNCLECVIDGVSHHLRGHLHPLVLALKLPHDLLERRHVELLVHHAHCLQMLLVRERTDDTGDLGRLGARCASKAEICAALLYIHAAQLHKLQDSQQYKFLACGVIAHCLLPHLASSVFGGKGGGGRGAGGVQIFI